MRRTFVAQLVSLHGEKISSPAVSGTLAEIELRLEKEIESILARLEAGGASPDKAVDIVVSLAATIGWRRQAEALGSNGAA
jgi:hypothetical protein